VAVSPTSEKPLPTTVPPGTIDVHAHVFTRRLTTIPHARYVPEDEAPVERYLDLLDAHGLSGAVLIQPSFLGADNSYLLAAMARVPARFRGVAVVAPDTGTERLAQLKAAGVAGIRLNLAYLPSDQHMPDFNHPYWRDFLKRVAQAGLHVELQAEGPVWPDIIKPLIASGARLVIDHFGRPSMGARCPGFQTLAAASRDADIWFKLSAPYRFQPPTAAWTCADVLLTIPGPGRLVWGSDWPWLQHARDVKRYADTIQWLSEWVSDEATRVQIFGANARTLYGFNKPAATAAPIWKRL
jgi:predicted TIM-barrel fold metal-dependent hydrolase